LDNNVLPEGNLPSHFALNVYQTIVLIPVRSGEFFSRGFWLGKDQTRFYGDNFQERYYKTNATTISE
jgi:hypothetical protein